MSFKLKNEDIDAVILDYLEKRNFKDAEKILKLELQATGSRTPGQKPQNALEEIENLILGAAGNGDATVVSEGYSRLAAWVDASLDAVRPELSRVLLPAFVHTYLSLVALGAIEEAQELKSLHGERFTDIPAQARQIAQLSTISLPEHLESSRAAVALKNKRHLVKMSAPSADLLSRFLRTDKRLLPLLSIINSHVELMLLEELPLGMGNGLLLLPGEDGGGEGDDGGMLFMDVDDDFKQAVIAEASGVNAKPVDLRLLAGGLEDAYFADVAEREEKEAQEKAEKDDNINKKQKKEFQKVADDARARKEAVGADRRPAPEIPLPHGFIVAPPDEKEKRSTQFATLKARATVSPTDPPSCAFYTFLNTNQTLSSSVVFSQDGSLVAAGFDDASVRLYNMTAAQSSTNGTTTSTALHNNGHTFINTAPLADQHINDDDDEVTLASAALSSSASAPPVTFLHGHSAPVYGIDIMQPEDSLLLSCSGDGTIRLWSLEMLKGGGSLVAYKGHMLPVWDVASCPWSGYYFASGGADRAGRIWCTERSKALRLLVGHTSDVDVVKWHPGCHLVATGSADTTVRVWDVRTGGCVRLLAGGGGGGGGGGGINGRVGGITAMSFSPNGMQLVTGDSLGAVSCWDLGSAKRLSTSTGGGGNRSGKAAVWSLAHSSGDGSVVASGGADRSVKLWSSSSSSSTGGGLSHFLTWQTKTTPVLGLRFSTLNLLLGGGPLALRKPQRL